jgi:protein gp37
LAKIKRKEIIKVQKTNIEWVKNPDGTPGYSWNPITGCLNGCEYCYARRIANGRVKHLYLANNAIAPVPYPITLNEVGEHLKDPFYPRFWPEKISGELNQRSNTMRVRSKGIFVCDMSDLFGIGIPEEWTRLVLDKIRMRSYHRFYLLTKQPQNLQKFSPFPDNCWVGVTATDRHMAHNAFKYLHDIEAKVKYLSIEPLLSWGNDPVSLEQSVYGSLKYAGIGWVIIGAQTKPYKPPKFEWVQEIVEAADKAGIPVFLKDSLKPLMEYPVPTSELCIYKFDKGELKLRQEMPA